MILLGFLGMMNSLKAQEHLNKQITLSVNRQPIADVLEIISNKGNFYFSYNSNILPKDSLVSLPAGTRTVRNLLELLFPTGFEFRESGQYIISNILIKFRAVLGPATVFANDGACILTKKTAELLQIDVGDKVRIVPN